MNYTKQLLDTLETVPTNSLMHELLIHSCPRDEYHHPLFQQDVKVMVITLHCFEYVVDCIYNNGKYIILSTVKRSA
jgi:hypothetical protein